MCIIAVQITQTVRMLACEKLNSTTGNTVGGIHVAANLRNQIFSEIYEINLQLFQVRLG